MKPIQMFAVRRAGIGVGAVIAVTTALGASGGALAQSPPPSYAAKYAGGSLTSHITGGNGGYASAATSYVTLGAASAATTGRIRVDAYGYIRCGAAVKYVHTGQLSALGAGDATTARTTSFTRNFIAGAGGYRLVGTLKFSGTLTGAGGSGTLRITGRARTSARRAYKGCTPTTVKWQVRRIEPIADATPTTTTVPGTLFFGGGTLPGALPDTLVLKTRADGTGIQYAGLTVPLKCQDGSTVYEEWLIPGAAIAPDGSVFMVKTFQHERIELRLTATAGGFSGTVHAFNAVDGVTCESAIEPVVARP